MNKFSYFWLSSEEKRLYDLFAGDIIDVDFRTVDWDDDITYQVITYKHPGYPDRVTEVAVNDMDWITTYINQKGIGRVVISRTKCSSRLSKMLHNAARDFVHKKYDITREKLAKKEELRLQNFLNGALTDKDFKE